MSVPDVNKTLQAGIEELDTLTQEILLKITSNLEDILLGKKLTYTRGDVTYIINKITAISTNVDLCNVKYGEKHIANKDVTITVYGAITVEGVPPLSGRKALADGCLVFSSNSFTDRSNKITIE